jgi:histidinol phosphatase-like enzyme
MFLTLRHFVGPTLSDLIMKNYRVCVETNDGCATVWYEKSRLKNACDRIHDRVLDQLTGLNLKRVEVSLSPATI